MANGKIWNLIGFWKKKKKRWDEELKGLYEKTFRITTRGGSGNIYLVRDKYDGEEVVFFTISDGGKGMNKWNVYTHYVLNEKGIEEAIKRLTDREKEKLNELIEKYKKKGYKFIIKEVRE